MQIDGITPASVLTQDKSPRDSGSLGQKDFLTLLTAQLKNQDPLKPMDNTEFLGQMAQFSTVAGIDRLNETLSGQGAGLRDARLTMATGMLGHSVLVQTPLARPDSKGVVGGAIDLTEPAQALVITYSDPRSGSILHSQTLGAQPAGRVPFEWSDIPQAIVTQRDQIRVTVTASQSSGTRSLDPMLYAPVLSASSAAGSDDVTLHVEDYGALSTLEIEALR